LLQYRTYFQNEEKENQTARLAVANTELTFQNKKKEKRAAELAVLIPNLPFKMKKSGQN
jgi:hypothetical protein